MKQIIKLFGDVESFLRGNKDLAPATRRKLLTYFDETRKTICLKIKMAIIVDVGSHFMKATYAFEGDGHGCIYSLDWTTGLDYWTGLLD